MTITAFRVVAATGLALAAGTLVGLTEKRQADRFRDALEPVDEKRGLYRLRRPVQFKAGEVVGLEGEIPKVLAEAVEATEPEKRGRKPREPKSTPKGADTTTGGADTTGGVDTGAGGTGEPPAA